MQRTLTSLYCLAAFALATLPFGTTLRAQQTHCYSLTSSLFASSPNAPALEALPNASGQTGNFATVPVPSNLCPSGGTMQAYHYSDNAGLSFDNAGNFISCEYTVEMTFRVEQLPTLFDPPWMWLLGFKESEDDGIFLYQTPIIGGVSVQFWDNNTQLPSSPAVPSIAGFNTTDWYQFVLTRTCAGMASIYLNGQLLATFNDAAYNILLPSAATGNQVIFFQDDPSTLSAEAAPGFVRDIKISNYALTEAEVSAAFDCVCESLSGSCSVGATVEVFTCDPASVGVVSDTFSIANPLCGCACDSIVTTVTSLDSGCAAADSTFRICFGGSQADAGVGIEVMGSDFYVTGNTKSYGAGVEDLFLTKIDQNGNLVWNRVTGTSRRNLAGGIRRIENDLLIYGQVHQNNTSVLVCDLSLMRFNQSGGLVWDNFYGISSGTNDETLGNLWVSNSGEILLSSFNAIANNIPKSGYLLKLNGEGNITWSNKYDTIPNDFEYIQETFSLGSAHYGTGYVVEVSPTTTLIKSPFFLMKLTPNGDLNWWRHYTMSGVTGEVYTHAQPLPQASSILLGGLFPQAGAGLDMVLFMVNENGEVQWTKTFGGPGDDRLNGIIAADANSFLICGKTTSSGSGTEDAFIAKFSNDGELLWAKTYGGAGNDNFLDIRVSDSGHIAAVGFSDSSVPGNNDVLFVKTTPDGDIAAPCCCVKPISFSSGTATMSFTTGGHREDWQAVTDYNFAIASPQFPICPAVCCITTDSVSMEICPGETFEGYGQTGIYVDTLIGTGGCDSIRVLNLTVFPADTVLVLAQTCDPDSAGTTISILQNLNGCDSVLVTTLEFVPLNCCTFSGIINEYSAVSDICGNTFTVDNPDLFSPGDTVLIYQAKGAVIDTSNTAAFGNILSYGNAGNFEFNIVGQVLGNEVFFQNQLLNGYDVPGKVQLITVPNLGNAAVCDLTCKAWDGNTGGVLVFFSDFLTLAGDVDVSGKGFRGGAVLNVPTSPCYTTSAETYDFYYAENQAAFGGKKGEGIALVGSGKTRGRGPLANGGGGGNDHNAGGGGGGNYGLGGSGGIGHLACAQADKEGLGGNQVVATNNKIFLGGGGGAAHSNDNFGTSGEAGGGIFILNANALNANQFSFKSNGKSAQTAPGHDAAGAGGAGGSLLINVGTYLGSLAVEVRGGNGGNVSSPNAPLHGPGGGGAGGVAIFSGSPTPASLTADLSGGQNGVFNGTNPHGAMPGQPGGIVDGQALPFAQTPFVPLHWTGIDLSPGCDGSYELSLSAGGSEQGFEFSIDGNVWQDEGLFEYVPPGSHSLSVRTSCAQLDTLVQVAQVDTLSLSVSLQGIDCDSPSGQAAAVALGGTMPYQFQLNGGAWQNGGVFVNLPQGDYLLSVQDSEGCSVSEPFTIEALVVPIDTVFGADFTCNPASVGTNCLTFTTPDGCDSTVCLTLQFAPLDTTFLADASTCDPALAGTFCQTLTTSQGCDSTVCQTYLLVLSTDTTFLSGTTCDPTLAGTSCETFTGFNGCDSVACLTLEFVALDTVWLPASTTCDPAQTGTFCQQFLTPEGCDSTVCEVVNYAAPLVSIYEDSTCDSTLAGTDTLLFGCDSALIFITSYVEFTATALPGDQTVHAGGNAQISLSLQPPGVVPASVSWSPADGLSCDTCLSTIAQPSETTVYQALVISAEGCEATASLRVEVLKKAGVYVPNAFSPNDDGINDRLTVFGGDEVARVRSFIVFDRWGERIFQGFDFLPNDVSLGWDGWFRGEALNPAVFTWFAEVEFVDGRVLVFEGDVTLLR